MSVVIDTSDLDCELETEEFEPENESENSGEPEIDLGEPDQESGSSTAVETDPPVDPPTTATDQIDDFDHNEFRAKMWNAEMRCRGKEAIVEDLKEQLKFAKADYDDSVAALRKLASGGLANEKPPVTPTASYDIASTADEDFEPESQVESESYEDTAWREGSLIELLKSSDISGLGDKKLEALSEIAKTFGEFQDLRVKASLEGFQLKELLPQGFGEKITDQIEEVFLNAMGNPLAAATTSEPKEMEGESEELDSKSEELSASESTSIELDDL